MAQGAALTHVLQVDLHGVGSDQGKDPTEDTGLPATGLLQFFHDCETYGNEAGDADAWLVRWVPRDEDVEASAWEPTPWPQDMDPEAYDAAVPLARARALDPQPRGAAHPAPR